MDWEKFEHRFFKEEGREKGADDRKIEKEAFDEFTANTVWKLATKGQLDYLSGVVSTGKEANVFKGWDLKGEVRAYKIYRMETSDFQAMWKYIEGDRRFEHASPKRRQIVLTWCRKEFKNLSIAYNAGCHVPQPHFCLNNILVMDFIGSEYSAPLLKGAELEDPEGTYWMAAKDMKSLYAAGLVHGDLSEFNLLWWKGRPWMIDMGQAVPLTHPRALEFLKRDCDNVAKFFSKLGVETIGDKLFGYITS